MEFHVDKLTVKSLATVFVVSLVWHSGDKLLSLLHSDHRPAISFEHHDTPRDSLGDGDTSGPNLGYGDIDGGYITTAGDNGGYITTLGNRRVDNGWKKFARGSFEDRWFAPPFLREREAARASLLAKSPSLSFQDGGSGYDSGSSDITPSKSKKRSYHFQVIRDGLA